MCAQELGSRPLARGVWVWRMIQLERFAGGKARKKLECLSKSITFGVPVVAQWQRTQVVSMKMSVRSLA